MRAYLCKEYLCFGMFILDYAPCFGNGTWLYLVQGSIIHGIRM